jgi:hypothetical protein
MQLLKNTHNYFAEYGSIRYYSLARYALIDALRLAGAVAGSSILLPEYICRDILASLHQIGAKPIWYEVSEDLKPLTSQEKWPIADIVLAINYFGFPQDLQPFKDYSIRVGALIIEDNAHGYLSRDENGELLGCRTNLGIFSMRKTIRIPDGAALWVKHGVHLNNLPSQLLFSGDGFMPAQKIKAILRSIPFIGNFLFGVSTALIRWIRKRLTGSGVPPRDPESEKILPTRPEPWKFLLANLTNFSMAREVDRRRKAYMECIQEADRVGATSVFKSLPTGCSPYGYSFRGSNVAVNAMKKFAESHQYDMVLWPDLPHEIMRKDRVHYRDVYLINFM